MWLIDGDALRKKMYNEAFETDSDMQRWDSGCWIRYKMFENALSSAPTIEAVPVVRCKDCKWYDMSKCMVTTEMGHHYVCRVHSYRPVPEDYCSQGERKDG